MEKDTLTYASFRWKDIVCHFVCQNYKKTKKLTLFHLNLCRNHYLCTQNFVYMEWNKDTLKEERTKVKMSQTELAKALGVHWRTVQNWEKGTSIPASVIPLLDKLFVDAQDVVPREEYNKVVAALNSATELNKKLTDIIQSGIEQK